VLGALQIVFAVSVVLAAISLASAVLRKGPQALRLGIAGITGGAAAASWAVFATHPHVEQAIAATGTTACFVAALAALAVRRALDRALAIDQETQRVRAAVRAATDEELRVRTTELEQALQLARAESISRLADEERRIAEQRRHAVVEREQEATRRLTASLIEVERRVEQRIAAWVGDLERGEARLAEEVERLATRQKDLFAQAETRLAADAERLEASSDQQRAHVQQLRVELEKVAAQALEQSRAELETHAAERRRALHEVSERLRARERGMQEQIEREEGEAIRRIQAGLAEIERRQLDQLKRIVDRTATSVSEAAAAEFDTAIRASREEAARRLSRELERAVDTFLRQAHGLLTEQLAKATETAEQRVDERANRAITALERARDAAVDAVDRHAADRGGALES
jgi:hypothetical protein